MFRYLINYTLRLFVSDYCAGAWSHFVPVFVRHLQEDFPIMKRKSNVILTELVPPPKCKTYPSLQKDNLTVEINFADFVSSLKTDSGSSLAKPKKSRRSKLPLNETGNTLVFPKALQNNSVVENTLFKSSLTALNCVSIVQQSSFNNLNNFLVNDLKSSDSQPPKINIENGPYSFSDFYHYNFLKSSQSSVSKSDNVSSSTSESGCKAEEVDSQLWTDRHAPSNFSDMVLRSTDTTALIRWIKKWNANENDMFPSDDCKNNSTDDDDDDCEPFLQSKTSKASFKGKKRKFMSPLSSDEDSMDSASTRQCWRYMAYLILGPTGCGKTSLVYALAAQFGFKVFEVNTSTCRSGKEVLAQCSAVVASQHVSKDCLSSNFSSFEMAKEHAKKEEMTQKLSRRKSCKRASIVNFFTPKQSKQTNRQKQKSKNLSKQHSSKEGLTLNNKSLVLFDEVDVLFDSDRGFWQAVGNLVRLGRRPILCTASDPSLLHRITIPIQVCHLLPIISLNAVTPRFKHICSQENLEIREDLLGDLLSLNTGNVPVNTSVSNQALSTSRRLSSESSFYDIRRAMNRLQWSAKQLLPSKKDEQINEDLLESLGIRFSRLFDLPGPLPSPHSFPKEHALNTKCIADSVFDGAFDSDNDLQPNPSKPIQDNLAVSEDAEKKSEEIKLPLPLEECKSLSRDMLDLLSHYTTSQATLDVCRSVEARDSAIRALSVSTTAAFSDGDSGSHSQTSLNVGLCGMDSGCLLTGMEACSELNSEWNQLLDTSLANRLRKLEETRMSVKIEIMSKDISTAKQKLQKLQAKAGNTLACVQSLRECSDVQFSQTFHSLHSGNSIPLDYLPSLRFISRHEADRRVLESSRRFHHYFDRIGLYLADDMRARLAL